MSDRKQAVLIAEDEDNDFWFFELAFKKGAGDVSLVRAHDGIEAIEYLAGEGQFSDRGSHPYPQLVVLDIHMPRKDGFEVLQWLHNQSHLHYTPAIVLSSSEEPADIQRAFKLGANSYLVKPRQYNRYATIVQLIREYWLHWNQLPIPGRADSRPTVAWPPAVLPRSFPQSLH